MIGNKKISLLLFFLFYVQLYCAIKVEIKTGIPEILEQKKVIVFITPQDGSAIFKKHMLFSIDSSYMIIKKWEMQERAQLEHVQSFGKEKKLFFKPFTIELLVDFLTRDIVLIISQSAKSSLRRQTSTFLS